MATLASEAIAEAQSLLNDRTGVSYTLVNLLPLLNKAYRELQSKLQKAGQSVTREVSEEIVVPAGTEALTDGDGLPNDLLYPIKLFERINNEWVPMVVGTWEPTIRPETRIRFWNWREESIKFVPATVEVTVLIRYMKNLPKLVNGDSPILINGSLTYLAARTAAIAAFVIGANPTRADGLNIDANEAWETMKSTLVKTGQSMPVRRRTNRYRQ